MRPTFTLAAPDGVEAEDGPKHLRAPGTDQTRNAEHFAAAKLQRCAARFAVAPARSVQLKHHVAGAVMRCRG